MSFINFPNPTPVFPVLSPLGWAVHKEPSFTSTVSKAMSGMEQMHIRGVFPRWKFTLSYGGDSWLREQTQNITPYAPLSGKTEFEQISALFLACYGSYGEFYFTDPDDNSRTQSGVGFGDGVTTTFLAYINWGTGNPQLNFPVSGFNVLSAVYLNGTPVNSLNWSVDSTNTKIIFTSPPAKGAVITATFTFYYRCRWMNDIQEYSQWAKNLWEYQKCEFISVKP